jgi:hypothetical protein
MKSDVYHLQHFGSQIDKNLTLLIFKNAKKVWPFCPYFHSDVLEFDEFVTNFDFFVNLNDQIVPKRHVSINIWVKNHQVLT